MLQQTNSLNAEEVENQELLSLESPENLSSRPDCQNMNFFYYCHDCGKIHSRSNPCKTLFCKICYEPKRKRNFARLMEYNIRNKRLIHLVIGFRKENNLPNKETKQKMEHSLCQFHRLIRKQLGYKFVGLRIFDLSDNGRYNHYHYAIVPESKMMNGRDLTIDVNRLRHILTKASKGFSEFVKVLGYRSKKNMFSYFSKRTAGRYGHTKDVFFLEDIMTYRQFQQDFYAVRKVVVIGKGIVFTKTTEQRNQDNDPEGISCNNARSRSICPYCHSTDVGLISILPVGEKFELPDWIKCNAETKERCYPVWKFAEFDENVVHM